MRLMLARLRGPMLVWAVLGALTACQRSAPEAGKPLLFPGLSEQQDQLQVLRLRGPGAAPLVTLHKEGGIWRVAQRDDWPADAARISQYLFVLSQAHGAEAKTSNPQLYGRLGVDAVTAAGASGSELELVMPGRTRRLLIGKEHPKFDGNYVRVDGLAQTWLTDMPISFDRDPAAWLDRRLLDWPLARVAKVRVRENGKLAFTLSHRDDRFRLDDAPSAAMRDSHLGDAIASALDNLRLEDVAMDKEAARPERELEFVAVDGTALTMQAWHVDDQLWVRLSASVDASKADEWAALDRGRRKDGPSAQAQAEQLNQRFHGRRFRLSPELAGTLMLSHEQILAGTPTP